MKKLRKNKEVKILKVEKYKNIEKKVPKIVKTKINKL